MIGVLIDINYLEMLYDVPGGVAYDSAELSVLASGYARRDGGRYLERDLLDHGLPLSKRRHANDNPLAAYSVTNETGDDSGVVSSIRSNRCEVTRFRAGVER